MPDADLLITGARIVSGGAVVEDGWLRAADGRIVARGSGAPPPHDGEVVDARGRILAPGFVDLHVHGGGGGEVGGGPGDLARMLAAHRPHGTTRTVLSLVSGTVDALAGRLRALAPLVRSDPLLLGVHLEGPFLSPDAKGAHDPTALTTPSPADVAALLAAAGGTLAQVTIAPERDGALAAVAVLRPGLVATALSACVPAASVVAKLQVPAGPRAAGPRAVVPSNTCTVVPAAPDTVPASVTAPLLVMRSLALVPVSEARTWAPMAMVGRGAGAGAALRLVAPYRPGSCASGEETWPRATAAAVGSLE